MKYLLTALFFVASFFASAQATHVKWKKTVEQTSDKNYNLIFEAQIEKGWHLYSQFLPPDGAMPTVFTFQNQNGNICSIILYIGSKV